jgi:hypothetical protein
MPIAFEQLTEKVKGNGKDQLLNADIAEKNFFSQRTPTENLTVSVSVGAWVSHSGLFAQCPRRLTL